MGVGGWGVVITFHFVTPHSEVCWASNPCFFFLESAFLLLISMSGGCTPQQQHSGNGRSAASGCAQCQVLGNLQHPQERSPQWSAHAGVQFRQQQHPFRQRGAGQAVEQVRYSLSPENLWVGAVKGLNPVSWKSQLQAVVYGIFPPTAAITDHTIAGARRAVSL